MILLKENNKLGETCGNTCINIKHLMIEFAVAYNKTTDICPIHEYKDSVDEQQWGDKLTKEIKQYGVIYYHRLYSDHMIKILIS